MVSEWGRREQELDELKVMRQAMKFWSRGFVSQQHVRYSDATRRVLNRFNIKPVVVVRNLFDVVVSLKDHVRKEDHRIPMVYLREEHLDLPDDALECIIARLAIPWYVNFYLGWREDPNAVFVSYEDLVRSPADVIPNVCDQLDFEIAVADAQSAVRQVTDSARNRFNVGKTGRGRGISEEAKLVITDMIRAYPEWERDRYFRSMVN